MPPERSSESHAACPCGKGVGGNEAVRHGASVQAFGKDDGQGVLPLGGRGNVLPQLRRGGVVGCLPEVGGFLLLRQDLRQRLLLRLQSDVLLPQALEAV